MTRNRSGHQHQRNIAEGEGVGGERQTDREEVEGERTLDLKPTGERLVWKLDSSKPSAVPEGEAPPLQDRGVVGLHLVESASFTL